MEEVVPVARLGRLGDLLGAGGQGRVFDAPDLRLPDAPGSLVYKEYKAVQQSAYGLRRLVTIRNGLDPDARRKLDERAAWPLRVVDEADRVRGVVMPRIPDSYFQERTLPGTGRVENGIREVQNLLIPPARAHRVGMPVPTFSERLMICRDFAAVLHFVHKNGLVVGDLSARNGLYRLDERPSVMLVDCDAIRVRGTMAAMAQLNSPDWDPPEKMLTQSSDRYKFGLFVLRCLSSGEQMSTTRDSSRADPALGRRGPADVPGGPQRSARERGRRPRLGVRISTRGSLAVPLRRQSHSPTPARSSRPEPDTRVLDPRPRVRSVEGPVNAARSPDRVGLVLAALHGLRGDAGGPLRAVRAGRDTCA